MAKWQNPEIIASILALAVLFVILLASSIVWFTRIYFKRIIEEKEKLARAKEENQRSLLRNSVLVQERERERIAKELHDDLVAKLTVVSVALQTPSHRIDPVELLTDSIITARGISHELLPPLLGQLTLEELVENFLSPLSSKYTILVHPARHREGMALSNEVKLQIFRIVQEIVQNIIKHAQASMIEIGLRQSPGVLSLLIRDNGVGMKEKEKTRGLGMQNIELRAQVLDGHFKFKSGKGKGTAFLFAMKLENENGNNSK